MLPVVIRPALPKDIEALRGIYNHAVQNTTATMDTLGRTHNETVAWLVMHSGTPYPALVAEEPENGKVVGFASLSAYHPRPGYITTAETTFYVHCDWQGLGIGTALMTVLIAEARYRGFVSLVALITSDNKASIRLHIRAGFSETGTLRRVARKFDQWVDITFFQFILDEDDQKNGNGEGDV